MKAIWVFLILSGFCFWSAETCAQQKTTPEKIKHEQENSEWKVKGDRVANQVSDSTAVFRVPEVKPRFRRGRETSMQKFIAANLKPVGNTKGIVICSFLVGADGKVSEPKVLKSLNPEADQEALRVVRLLEFIPGRENGQVLAVPMSAIFRFGNK